MAVNELKEKGNFLTDKQEIVRLRKVVDEKNSLIERFKSYDDERKKYYAQVDENYKIMEQKFSEINEAIGKCEGLDSNSKEYYQRFMSNLKLWNYNNEIETVLNKITARLDKLKQHVDNIDFLISMVDDKETKKNLQKELRSLNSVRENIIQFINNKLK